MKFLPYEGFYPAQRTQQIAQLFSQSYGPALETPGSASFRVLQTPFFGPGILYNSIKSGISLPFPISTNPAGVPTSSVAYTGVGSGVTYPYKFIQNITFANYFKYLSFESILSPAGAINKASGNRIYDYETMIEASASATASITSKLGGRTYEYSINNFLAETLNLFNNKEKSGIILSNPDNNFNIGFDTTKTYSMDIEFNEIVENYSRRSAFGAPVADASTPEGDSYSIYTPGYRANSSNSKINNVKVLRLEFNPTKETHTADEILSSLTGTYYAADGTLADGTATATTFVPYTDMVNLIKVPLTINNNAINTPAFGIGIQPKWQSPILDFSARTASVPPTENQDFYSTGMWHQYGALPSTDTTVEIKVVKSSNTTNGNLAEVLGFSDKSINIGHLPDKKEVKEAIIAVPFIKDQDSNERNFFEIDRKYIADALYRLGKQDDLVREGHKAGRSIIDMVAKMHNYVLPPRFDFLTYKEVDPIAMYIFEFSHTFSKQDLADIWQNLPPTSTQFDQDITTGFKVQTSKLDYYTNYSSRAKELYGFELPVFDAAVKGAEIRWMIFKVKQKAATNYFDTLASVPMETDSIKERYPMVNKIPYSIPNLPRHSYNWPYDYFSMVELIKVDAEVSFGKGIVRNPGEFNIPLPPPQPPVLPYIPPPDGPRRAPGDVEDSTRGDNYFETTGADERQAEQRRRQARELRSLNENIDDLRDGGPGLVLPDNLRRRR